jgi:hypothetical protein
MTNQVNKDRQPFYHGDRVEFDVAPGAWVPRGYDSHVTHEVKSCEWHEQSGWLLEIKGHSGSIGAGWFIKPEEICPLCHERLARAEAAPEFVPMSWQEAERIMLGVGENGEIICYSQTIRHCASSYIRLLDAVKAWVAQCRKNGYCRFVDTALAMIQAAGIKA